MTGCKECYRRERRELGVCVKDGCGRRGELKADGSRYQYCRVHRAASVGKARKKRAVKKHVLNPQTFRQVKKMLAAESPVLNEIAKHFGVSRRTIDRVAKGEYDSYFKGMALRNAASQA